MLNVALAKGRLADSCADIFMKCGIQAQILKEETRKLVLETPDGKFKFFLSSLRTFRHMWNMGSRISALSERIRFWKRGRSFTRCWI